MPDRPPPSSPDVCLILEGTYPYVPGGVSTWVHQMITALPELKFFVFYIGSGKPLRATPKYVLPPNVTGLHECYLHAPAPVRRSGSVTVEGAEKVHQAARQLMALPSGDPALDPALTKLAECAAELSRTASFEDFWRDPGTWHLIRELYLRHAEEESFLGFFWSVRSLLEPVWRLIAALDRLPAAGMYHSLCTGYAGLAGGLAAARHKAPFLLSEHGIYVRERIADLLKARWIQDPPVLRPGMRQRPALLRRVWTGFFEILGQYSYQTAGRITTLFSRNAVFQQELGAPPAKLEIIPNGVHLPDFEAVAEARLAEGPPAPVVGFLGRVVSIKDVKTLLRAARLTADLLPDVRFLIAGPMDEEPEYAAACQELCRALDLEAHVEFLGPARREDLLPRLSVMLLTSLSEGLPFVILEAFAAGIPCVSTDVGACRELIEGRPGEAPAGLVVPVGQTEQIASALIRLLSDPGLATQYGAAGRQRAAAGYSQNTVINRYRELYSGSFQTSAF